LHFLSLNFFDPFGPLASARLSFVNLYAPPFVLVFRSSGKAFFDPGVAYGDSVFGVFFFLFRGCFFARVRCYLTSFSFARLPHDVQFAFLFCPIYFIGVSFFSEYFFLPSAVFPPQRRAFIASDLRYLPGMPDSHSHRLS